MTREEEALNDAVNSVHEGLVHAFDRLSQLAHAISFGILPDYSHVLPLLRGSSVVSASPVPDGGFEVDVRLPSGETVRYVITGWEFEWTREDDDPPCVKDPHWVSDHLVVIGREIVEAVIDLDQLVVDHVDAVMRRLRNRFDHIDLPGVHNSVMRHASLDARAAIVDGIEQEESRLAQEAFDLCRAISGSARSRCSVAAVRAAALQNLIATLRDVIPLLPEEDIALAMGEARAIVVMES